MALDASYHDMFSRSFALNTLFLLVLLLAGCSKGDASKEKKGRPPPLVAVARVALRDVPVEIRAPVDLRPLAQADVGSKALGYLDAVLVDRGDKVKKGQTLALVRPSDLPDQLASARGALSQSEASLSLARTNYERAKALSPNGVVSQQSLQIAAAAVAQAEAQEAGTKAQVSALATRLGETRIESPMDGVVLIRRLDPGALVGPPGGGAIVTVARVDTLRVFVAVNERDAAGLSLGKEVNVEVDALPGKRFAGRVVRLAPAFDPVTRTMEAEVHLANVSGELRPGMYGRAAILLETHPKVPVVPIAALQISNNKRYTFVVAGDKVQRRSVETGVDGETWMEVVQGLSMTDEVVIAGADGLSDGATVRVSRGVDPYTGQKTADIAPSPTSSASAN